MLSLSRHKPRAEVAEEQVQLGNRANDIRLADSPLEGGVYAVSGILRFTDLPELEAYLRGLLDVYRKEYERTSDTIGELYRTMGDSASVGMATGSWDKVGSFFVDSTSLEKGEIDVALQLLNDLKPKLTKAEQAVADFRLLDELPVPPTSSFLLYIRNGAPERIVVDSSKTQKDQFVFTGEYLLVQ